MAHVNNLPEELVEEILHRVPSPSLTRFRTVSKEWNTLFDNKTFIKKHLAFVRTQFLLWTNSKVYSVGVNLNDDLKVELCELPLYIPDLMDHRTTNFLPCNDLLLCASWWWKNKAAVWNPSLKQIRWIKSEEEHFWFGGIGYDKPGKGYHIFGHSHSQRSVNGNNTSKFYKRFSMYKFGSNEWKCINAVSKEETFIGGCSLDNNVSLNGNLYWAAFNFVIDKYFIQSFDFSKEISKIFCVLPWKRNCSDIPVLSVFRGDRLSVLNKFKRTNNIEIWVTKNKISKDVEKVVWMIFMTVSIPIYKGSSSLSYFINDLYEKRLVMCCSDENGNGCIYIVRGNARKKIQIGFDVSEFSHCFYDPSMNIPIPSESLEQEINNN